MKRTLLTIAVLMLTLILSTGIVFADTSSSTVNLVIGNSTAQINGQNVKMAAPAQVVSGKTLVPLRFISEAFGCEVSWDGATRTANVKLDNQQIQVPIGKNYVVVNGVNIDVDVPGQLIVGNTYVPLRFVAENLGAKVEYNAATHGVSILMNTYKNKTHNFQMILPNGWSVAAEDNDGIKITNGGDCSALLSLVDEEDGVTPGRIDVDALIADYKSKDGFYYSVDDSSISMGYLENGMIEVIVYDFIDSGVYVASFEGPVDKFDDTISGQCDLMINTLKTYTN